MTHRWPVASLEASILVLLFRSVHPRRDYVLPFFPIGECRHTVAASSARCSRVLCMFHVPSFDVYSENWCAQIVCSQWQNGAPESNSSIQTDGPYAKSHKSNSSLQTYNMHRVSCKTFVAENIVLRESHGSRVSMPIFVATQWKGIILGISFTFCLLKLFSL